MLLVIDLIDVSPAGVEIKADEISRTITIYKALTLLRDVWTKVSPATTLTVLAKADSSVSLLVDPKHQNMSMMRLILLPSPPERVSASAWDSFLAFDDGLPVSGFLSDADILQSVLPKTTNKVSDEDDDVSAAVEQVPSNGELCQHLHLSIGNRWDSTQYLK